MSTLRTTHRTPPVERGSVQDLHTGGPRSAPARAAWTAAALFCLVATFHAALIFGAPWGEYTQRGGTSGTLTSLGRVMAAASCILSIVMAGAILARAGQGPLRRLPASVRSLLAWFTTVYAVIGVVLNLVTRSTAERALWAPVSIVLLGLVVFVMVTTRRNHVASRGAPRKPTAHHHP